MKQNLGKIVLLISLAINLIAGVDIKINPPAAYKGERVNITISADGKDIKFPQIDEIEGYTIEGTSSSQSTTVINGDVTREISKTYTFSPQKSVTIPSYKVEVDGKTYKTDEKKVSVLKPTASKNGSEFIVQTKVDKKEAHVGEAVKFTVIFKQRLDAKAAKLQLSEPKIENFWVKKVDGSDKITEGEYIVQKIHYILFPQKAGKYTIAGIEADVGKVAPRQRARGMFNDPFFDDPFFNSFTNQIRWQKIFSDEIKLDIKPLPNNLELFGDFSISATVDKDKVKANKPLNLTIHVKGEGNIDDIKKFNVDIDEAIIYADEPKITSTFTKGIYAGEFRQKIAIIADKNYTIPPIEMSFVDKKSQKVKTVKTDPIPVIVKGGTVQKATSQPKLEVANESAKFVEKAEKKSEPIEAEITKDDSHVKYLFFIMGIFIGLLLAYLYNMFTKTKVKKELDIIKDIKKAKSDKALFETLLPYSKEGILISKTLQKLEENLYSNGLHKIDKNELLDFFEELEEKI